MVSPVLMVLGAELAGLVGPNGVVVDVAVGRAAVVEAEAAAAAAAVVVVAAAAVTKLVVCVALNTTVLLAVTALVVCVVCCARDHGTAGCCSAGRVCWSRCGRVCWTRCGGRVRRGWSSCCHSGGHPGSCGGGGCLAAWAGTIGARTTHHATSVVWRKIREGAVHGAN